MDPLVYPNSNADVYRYMTPADRPPVPDKNLQFILIYNEKSAILGGSNMTDRYWSGTVWHYNDISDFNRYKALVATKTESGVCDGAYLERNKFVVGEDSGVLQVLGVVEDTDTHVQKLECLHYACQHDDSLITLSVFSDNKHLVTGGMDYHIKVWDTNEMIQVHSFNFAHTNIVTSVDVQLRNDSIFVSTSLDCEALMWDIRQPKPAQSILKKNIGLTASTWNNILDHIVAVGTEDGNVSLVDIRKTGTSLQESCIFSRAVHKVLFNPNPERFEQMACCSDDICVKICDINRDFAIIYENVEHKDFVRGLTWYKDELFSCAWDDTVIKHVIHSPDDQ